jgi:hypothetical protein
MCRRSRSSCIQPDSWYRASSDHYARSSTASRPWHTWPRRRWRRQGAMGRLGYDAAGATSRIGAARHPRRRAGAIPAAPEALRALPGVGAYTAGAVAASLTSAGRRLWTRTWRGCSRACSRPTSTRSGRGTSHASGASPRRCCRGRGRPRGHNQALMELGADGVHGEAAALWPLPRETRVRDAGAARVSRRGTGRGAGAPRPGPADQQRPPARTPGGSAARRRAPAQPALADEHVPELPRHVLGQWPRRKARAGRGGVYPSSSASRESASKPSRAARHLPRTHVSPGW